MPKENSDDIVIPIATNSCPTASPDWHKFSYYTHNLLTPNATTQVSNAFPFDLSFAMTIHKVQGRTIKRVVLISQSMQSTMPKWSLQLFLLPSHE